MDHIHLIFGGQRKEATKLHTTSTTIAEGNTCTKQENGTTNKSDCPSNVCNNNIWYINNIIVFPQEWNGGCKQ